jgi:hypothetical protein
MFKRIAEFGLIFFSLLLLFGIFLGFLGVINIYSASIAIFASVIFALGATYFLNKTRAPIKLDLKAILLVGLFLVLLLVLIVPEFVFPVTCSDFLNHARTTRGIAKNGSFIDPINMDTVSTGIPLVYAHHYPFGFYAISSQVYLLFPNAYIVNTLLTLSFLVLTSIFIYLIAFKLTVDKNIALLSLGVSLFSITTIWIFEHGFIPQILGSFFLIAALYAYLNKSELLWLFAVLGAISYPPLFAVLIIFIILQIMNNFKTNTNYLDSLKNNIKSHARFIIIGIGALLVGFPEVFGLAFQYLFNQKYLTGALLIRGGIFTPNFFGLLIFIPALFLFYNYFIKNKEKSITPVMNMFLAAMFMVAMVMVYFVLNLVFTFNETKQIHSLYQAVKFFYFALIPASIFAGIGFNHFFKRFSKSKLKFIFVALILFNMIYFVGYLPVLNAKDSELPGYYASVEFIDSRLPEFVAGVDGSLMFLEKVEQPFFYRSLIDNPDPVGPNICREIEATRALQFWWSFHDFEDGRFRIYDSNNIDKKEVLLIGDEINLDYSNIDYFLTDKSINDLDLVFESGLMKVYKTN